MRILIIVLISIIALNAGQFDKVKITPDMSYLYVYHKGKAVKVHRIQDTKNKLTGEYARQFRPGQDIQSIEMHKNIQTIGEVELLSFMKKKVNNKEGLLVDLRDKEEYAKESIPSAVNIPASVKNDKTKIEKIFKILGAIRASDGSLDVSSAQEVAFYCNGLWCNKTSEFINAFLDLGYPAEKILYYRGGFQMWKILGFTTATNNKERE